MKTENQGLTTSERTTVKEFCGHRRLVVVSLLPVFLILAAAALVWGIGGSGVGIQKEFLSAVILSIVAAGAGSAAITLTWRFWPSYLPQGILVAMVLRMLITLAGILILALILGSLGLHFILLIIGFYAIGLISETIIALKITLRREESEQN